MALSFLSYKVDREFLPSHFFLHHPLLLYLYLYMYYTPLFLLCHFLLPPLSNSMLLCSFYTICCTAALCLGNSASCSPEFLFPCSHILCIPQGLLLPILSSTSQYSLLLLMEVTPSPYNAILSSPIPFKGMPPLFFFSLLDTPTSCVPPFHTGNTSLSTPLLPVSLPPLLHTASPSFPILQIYFLLLSSSSVLLCFYSSG